MSALLFNILDPLLSFNVQLFIRMMIQLIKDLWIQMILPLKKKFINGFFFLSVILNSFIII